MLHSWFLWLIGIAVGLIIVVFLVFHFSPWPGALIIRFIFNKDSYRVTKALEAHAPKSGITVIHDQPYQPDVSLDVYFPESASNKEDVRLPVVVWTHGGAWVSGHKTDYAAYYQLIAQQGYVVVVPTYSLAPEKRYPTPLHQMCAVYTYIQENTQRFRADTHKIILAGDSAGSQITAQMAAIITNSDYAKEVGIVPTLQPSQLRGVVLNCGIYKMDELVHPDPTLPKLVGWGNDVTVWAYSGTKNFSDPVIKQMSPYYHVTKDFPATYISGGNVDPLTNVQSKPFAELLKRLGIPVTTLFYPDDYQGKLGHEYQFNLDNKDGKNALQETLEFIKKRTEQ